jgi:hypothetical protein
VARPDTAARLVMVVESSDHLTARDPAHIDASHRVPTYPIRALALAALAQV